MSDLTTTIKAYCVFTGVSAHRNSNGELEIDPSVILNLGTKLIIELCRIRSVEIDTTAARSLLEKHLLDQKIVICGLVPVDVQTSIKIISEIGEAFSSWRF